MGKVPTIVRPGMDTVSRQFRPRCLSGVDMQAYVFSAADGRTLQAGVVWGHHRKPSVAVGSGGEDVLPAGRETNPGRSISEGWANP
jgi:hypothetical protein